MNNIAMQSRQNVTKKQFSGGLQQRQRTATNDKTRQTKAPTNADGAKRTSEALKASSQPLKTRESSVVCARRS